MQILDGYGNVLNRTKFTHPYNYDPILQWHNRNGEPNGTVYTDRLLQWDYAKHNDLCEKHFGNKAQYWDNRDPVKVEAFLRDYLNAPDLILCAITEHCNQATGFPLWRLDYQKVDTDA